MVTRVQDTYQKEDVGAISFETNDALFRHILANPVTVDKKPLIPGLVFSEFKEPYSTRTIDQVKEVDSDYFGLDIDDGMTIQEFYTTYKDYQFYLYSTFSHTPGHHKFRVVFKGSLPNYGFENEEGRKNFRLFLKDTFPFIDQKAIGPERILYMPATPNSGDKYVSLANDGIDYVFPDFEKFVENIEAIAKRKKRAEQGAKLYKLRKQKKSSKSNKPTTYNKQINTMATWIKCNGTGKVEEFLNNHSSSCYETGGAGLLYYVLLSAKALNVDSSLIDDIHDIQRSWNRQNTQYVWDHTYKSAGL